MRNGIGVEHPAPPLAAFDNDRFAAFRPRVVLDPVQRSGPVIHGMRRTELNPANPAFRPIVNGRSANGLDICLIRINGNPHIERVVRHPLQDGRLGLFAPRPFAEFVDQGPEIMAVALDKHRAAPLDLHHETTRDSYSATPTIACTASAAAATILISSFS